MALLRAAAAAARLSAGARTSAPLIRAAVVPALPRPGQRGMSALARSTPRRGHNLEDHFDMAEFVCKMHSPTGEYFIWGCMLSTVLIVFGPLLHSNYYFTGRFVPKDQGNTQLCDDSW
eukprot:TRINITY_DN37171_c0_g1_i1.p2 TRINITY_DN37171_c0_g1~~TRINITY_DN37171_c0_g1_i1.p2  ORF type:complete len:137 (+),score=16.72 TRINITY_DN37171_c0_g1_i1:59-412(+)